MIICSNCQTPNRSGLLFCEECGYSLTDSSVGSATIPTRRVENDPDEASAKGTWGVASYNAGSELIIHVRDGDPITVTPKQRVVFGRSDKHSDKQPDVDFAPYGAVEKGVSRQHAVVEIAEDTLMLLDIGSSNGTYLNGQRLTPHQPRVLRDGDEIRLGKLVTHIYFG